MNRLFFILAEVRSPTKSPVLSVRARLLRFRIGRAVLWWLVSGVVESKLGKNWGQLA